MQADAFHNGEVVIACDQDFQYVMEQQREVFEAAYPGATIRFKYMSDGAVMEALYRHEFQEAIIGRKLLPNEYEKLTQVDSVRPREHLMAKDALVFIVGKQSSIKQLNFESLFSLEGNNAGKSNYSFVFDSKQTGLIKSFQAFKNMNSGLKVFALDSLEAVINYVNTHDDAVGCLPFAKVSDDYNPAMQQILKNVNVLAVEKKDSTGRTIVNRASQAEIAINEYPFIRPLNYIICNPMERVGTGFVNFLFKNQGEKIFLKSGLIPMTMPERDFIINSDGIDVKK